MGLKEIVQIGIVVKTEDYKENDKLLWLLTPDKGVITAKIIGVKKEKAKLKFAAMPFSFCEYTLLESNGFYKVKTASSIESLIGVTASPEKYLAASIALECGKTAGNIDTNPVIFINLLKVLKKIIYSDVDAFAFSLNYVFSLLLICGYVIATEEHKLYIVDIDQQTDIGENGVARIKLVKIIKIFEQNFSTHIKAAELL